MIALLLLSCAQEESKSFYTQDDYIQSVKKASYKPENIEADDKIFCFKKYPRSELDDVDAQASFWYCRYARMLVRSQKALKDKNPKLAQKFKSDGKKFKYKSDALKNRVAVDIKKTQQKGQKNI